MWSFLVVVLVGLVFLFAVGSAVFCLLGSLVGLVVAGLVLSLPAFVISSIAPCRLSKWIADLVLAVTARLCPCF